MQFGVLGPLAVTTDAGESVTVPGTKVRVLLADLLTNRNQVVSADRLIDDLWGEDAPANAAGALQVRVSQLRKALNDAEPGARDLVESRAPGYVLRTGAVDADTFAELAESSDADRLGAALRLWRGDPYADVADAEFVRAEATRLADQRLAVLERLADARLARGEHDLVAADLAELVALHPLREGLRALHLRALYAAGRQSEALDSYADLRERLAEELGLDPSPELAALHQQILAQDAGLAAPPKAALLRNSLPARLDDLVGRAEVLADVRAQLAGHRLVTLVGPGGVGKTRLAVEAARESGEAFLVELAPLPAGDPDLVEHVLGALGVRDQPGEESDPAVRLAGVLGTRRILLVLDNCEHVVEPAAELVARLLRDAPGLTVLATSREPLGLTGELVWEVPPLALPAADDLDSILRSPAARLFAARAAAHQRTFRLDERTAPAVAQLCRRLDGLPLALELAATRVRSLGVTGLLSRLDDRFRLLTTQQRDMPARQRTLTAVIGWSWDLLEEPDRVVLSRLAVFSGGCTLDAAEAVCGADPDTLARLVDRSLVVASSAETPRYSLLESVAAFGLERLENPDDVRAEHAAYFTGLAVRADPELRGPDQKEWLTRLDAETANLRAALSHGAGPRLADALTWYWFLRGRLTEAYRALAGGGDPGWRAGFALMTGRPTGEVEIPDELGGRVAWFVAYALVDRGDFTRAGELLDRALADGAEWTEAAVLSQRAKLFHATGDLAALERDGNRSAELFERLGDRWGQLQASEWLGGLAEIRGEMDRAVAIHHEGLRWAEELDLAYEVGGKLSWLAWLAVQTGDYSQARELGERAYRMAEEHGSPAAMVFAELSLAFAARRDGKLDLAVTHLEHLIRMGRAEATPALYLPMVLVELGYAEAAAGDPVSALARHREAFDIAEAMNSVRDFLGAAIGAASVLPGPSDAARLLGAVDAARVASEMPAAADERAEVEQTTARLVAALGEDAFRVAYEAGGALTPAEAMRPA